MRKKNFQIDYKWHSIFRNSQNKFCAVEVGFFLWMLFLIFSLSFLTIYLMKIPDVPSSIVHITIALSGVKITHKLAEGKWAEIIKKFLDFFKKKSKV
jgi:hypothetical protein